MSKLSSDGVTVETVRRLRGVQFSLKRLQREFKTRGFTPQSSAVLSAIWESWAHIEQSLERATKK